MAVCTSPLVMLTAISDLKKK